MIGMGIHTKALYLEELAKQWLLSESFTDNPGLLNGKTGLAIYFFQYARYSGNKKYDTFARDLIDEVAEEINALTPVHFRDGLCGIGWGIIYLIRNHFLEGNIDEILEDIDEAIFNFDIRTCYDTSFETGSDGIVFYRTFRKELFVNSDPFELTLTFGNVSLHINDIFDNDNHSLSFIQKSIWWNSVFKLSHSSKSTSIKHHILVAINRYDTLNPFVNSLTNELRNYFTMNVDLEEFWCTRSQYQIIHIHWPEAVFQWKMPSDSDLTILENTIQEWKRRGTLFVYTRHNIRRHYSSNAAIHERLYSIIENNSDLIVHLGEYSKNEWKATKKIAKRQVHTIIPHHIYEDLYRPDLSVCSARERLGISDRALVTLAFGIFRDQEEREWTMNAFEEISIQEKVLLAPRWGDGSVKTDNLLLGNQLVSPDDVPLYFAAANIVFIQRLEILNSGNLPLAFLFNKPVVGPDRGNVGEILRKTNNYYFTPGDIRSVKLAFSAAIFDIVMGEKRKNREYALTHYNVRKIGLEYRDALCNLMETNLMKK